MKDLSVGLSKFLSEIWETDVSVRNLDRASAGARRHNLLFNAVTEIEDIPLVATILPTPDIEDLPMDVEASVLEFARKAGVPAPRLVGVTTNPKYVGGSMFVTHRVFGESNIDFVVVLQAADRASTFLLESELIERLHERFKEEGIEINYPVRKVVWPESEEFLADRISK